MKKRTLLLNLPADRIYLRDYYCSKTSKTNYFFHPIDLLMQSGILSQDMEVKFVDALLNRMDFSQCLSIIQEFMPHAVLFTTGSVSWKYDLDFIKALKNVVDFKALASGDIFLEDGDQWLKEYEFLDGAILDFFGRDILHYMEGRFSSITDMIFRQDGNITRNPKLETRNLEFEIPIPRHDLFIDRRYKFSFAKKKLFATVLTDFGCPFNCSFCIMGKLPFKYRKVDNCMDELRFIHSLGIREIFFADQTFGALKQRTRELCNGMIDERFDFGWSCYSRVDVLDENMLQIMKEAGCHTIMFGVESGSDEILKEYKKRYLQEDIYRTFHLCKRMGIRTVATFILGLPEDTRETISKTVKFLKNLDCDYASFNIAVPRMGTDLREKAIFLNLIKPGLKVMDQSGSSVVMPTMTLSQEELRRLKRKVITSFYLRPSYIWKRILKSRSFYEFRSQLEEAIALFRNVWLR